MKKQRLTHGAAKLTATGGMLALPAVVDWLNTHYDYADRHKVADGDAEAGKGRLAFDITNSLDSAAQLELTNQATSLNKGKRGKRL